ncbi:MAG: hypothetical protein JXA03_16225, partial [Bacteroidales bacterium]|nr:hypothetical protein [Bacteroidales bacterium]
FIKNEFAAACLRAEVQWSIADYIPGALLLSGGVIFILFAARKMKTAVISLFISALLAVNLSALLLAPKAGQFVQRAAIDFYRAHSNGASYVKPLGFKSYAYLFYTNKQKPENPNHNNKDWLLHGAVDKPVYFVVRVTEARQHEEWFPDFIRLYEKNGFVFYLREMPEKQPQ